ncbi:MAG: hypothetical protein WA954_06740 [Parerythrobacter sp.]
MRANARAMLVMLRLVSCVLAAVAISGCSDAAPAPGTTDADPVVQRALNDPLMIDPDLSSQNLANAALSFEIGHPVPPENADASAALAAREAALKLLKGATPDLQPVADNAAAPGDAEALNVLGRLKRLGIAEKCLAGARFSALWVTRLPDGLEPYPRASVKEAAGTDAGGCEVRGVIYLSPVSIEDIIAFHAARASDAGFATEYRIGEGWHLLSAEAERARFEIAGRTLAGGLSEVSIASAANNRP